jgi:hypothetical protein
LKEIKMPKGFPPSVFVSSTCYDLNQVRADLKEFLNVMGFDPILSDTPEFPVSPNISPINNCLKAVKERADIFVLIIGARYGSQSAMGKSVTNLEYLEARAKGLPVYIFVSKQILNILPVWKKNPSADYSQIVDTPKLFDFVDTLHSSQDHWVYGFDEIKHIIDTLRQQFAYLFMEGLVLREKVKDLKIPAVLSDLSGKSLRLLFERPIGWEYSFFSSVLAGEMELNQELKWDLKYALKTQKIKIINDFLSVNSWLSQKMDDLLGITQSWDALMNKAIQDALREKGVPGDPEHLVYVARRMAQFRKLLLGWTIEFNCTKVPTECERLLFLLSESSKDIIEKIENIPSQLDSEISKAIEAHKRGEKYEAKVFITLSVMPHSEEFCAEIRRLSELHRPM